MAMRLALDTRAKKLGAVAAIVGVATIGLAAATLFASLNAVPRQIFAPQPAPLAELAVGSDVAGWAALDRDSVHVGQVATLTLRVVYRDGVIEPDLDTFRRSMTLGRFSTIDSRETKRVLAPGISEFTVRHQLQGVTVLPHQTYQLDPIVLFYKSTGSTAGELQKLRIAMPMLHVSGYYPEEVTGLSPQPVRGKIHDPVRLRQTTVMACGLILGLIAASLIWHFGRRRRPAELSDAERLWLNYEDSKHVRRTPRDDLLFCESVFTPLRQACTLSSAEAFWTGEDPDNVFWRDASERARAILRANYRPSGTNPDDIDAMHALLRETFTSVVAEERLKREREPSLLRRLALTPLPSAAAGICAVLCLILFALGLVPTVWLSPWVARHNAALDAAQHEPARLQAANDLFALGQQPARTDLRAAALYNSGTLLASLDPLSQQLATEPMGIIERFKDAASLEAVIKSQVTLALAVERLRDAVVVAPRDEDIGRNLELIGKRHRIVVAALIELIKMQEERVVEMQDLRLLLDALNMVLNEDARDNERAQKPDYYIGEKF